MTFVKKPLFKKINRLYYQPVNSALRFGHN